MVTRIADDATAIARGLAKLKREKEEMMRGKPPEHPDIIQEDCVTQTYMGIPFGSAAAAAILKTWTEEEVEDGNSPPWDQLEQITGPDGRTRYRLKT